MIFSQKKDNTTQARFPDVHVSNHLTNSHRKHANRREKNMEPLGEKKSEMSRCPTPWEWILVSVVKMHQKSGKHLDIS